MESLLSKEELRFQLKEMRAAISSGRREEASHALILELLPSLVSVDFVLSFASIHSEIDTSLLNLFLARTNRLLLPKIEGKSLTIYQVLHPSRDLKKNRMGLLEPNPKFCPQVDPTMISIALIPALGFDEQNQRIGYGFGFYDRFLKKHPHIHTIGIGYREQLLPSLPIQEHDTPLEKVTLF